MERTTRAKADHVVCWRQGRKIVGSLHLMAHHMLFRYQWPQKSDEGESEVAQPAEQPTQEKPMKETWIGYALIGFCTYRPSPYASHLPPQIRIRCRDFSFFAFHFDNDTQAREIYDTIRNSTCKIDHVSQLLAFSYTSNAEKACNGWNLYDPRRELARMGISEKSKDRGWRVTNINNNYAYAATYPAVLCIPSSVSDNTLKYTASFRSKARIPVLTYLHALNDCSITRSAQPSAGIRGTRSPQDEKLVNAIFKTTRPSTTNAILAASASQSSQASNSLNSMIDETSDAVDVVQLSIAESNDTTVNHPPIASTDEEAAQIVQVYGAQQTNLIVDARPSVNAMANQALGYGSENMEGYPSARKVFLGIENIHVMRKSLEDVFDALKDSDLTTLPPLYAKLEKSLWKDRISKILAGARLISNTIAIQHSHVLIHCSDGWDRTSQLSALSQICLDPYYRTLEGFMVLIEKDFVSFGHMFRLRAGLLQHEKWFEVENERTNLNRNVAQAGDADGSDGAGNAFENALAKAQGFFRRKVEKDEDKIDGSVNDFSPARGTSPRKDERMATRPKEVSPIFHQFLDATYQLLRQYPTRFEFNERFLRRLFYHLYSCQYGNFLFNSEKELVEAKARSKTHSVWGYFLSKRQQFLNEKYDPSIDESTREKSSLIEPDQHDIRWWHELFGRTEKEMEGPILHAYSAASAVPDSNAAVDRLEASTSSDMRTTTDSKSSSQFGTMTVDVFPSFGSGTSSDRFARMSERPPTIQQVEQEKQATSAASEGWLSNNLSADARKAVDVELQ